MVPLFDEEEFSVGAVQPKFSVELLHVLRKLDVTLLLVIRGPISDEARAWEVESHLLEKCIRE